MADEDEIDILGDFSFNSCLAQNNQGIPSCSNREDTVHPQWLLDSIANNWYDSQSKDRAKGPSRKLSGNNSKSKYCTEIHTMWNQHERELLVREMTKYGRNIRKISQTIKTKTEAEIQALIEAEYGVHLETPSFGLDKHEDHDDVPTVVQEEIVTDELPNPLNMVATGTPTISMPFRRKHFNTKPKTSLLRQDALIDNKKSDLLAVSPSEIFYEDDLIIGSTESIGSDLDSVDVLSRNILIKQQKEKMQALKKIGNHRRKGSRSRSSDRGKPRNRSKDLLKSPQGRQRKDSSMSEDSTQSPKMQIVFSSGQALPVSDGEQIIKIEKKKDSEPDSDIEIDIDSDQEGGRTETKPVPRADEAPIAVPLRNFEPMPKRHKRINLDGEGGYTIMHTESGDLYAIGAEPRKERPPKKQPVHLIQCRLYSAERPAPYIVRMHVSALIGMDAHAHTSRAEVMGLAGGRSAPGALGTPPAVTLHAYRPAAAAACGTHCDMDPVSQAAAAECLHASGLAVSAWHHSHPVFPPTPSALDLRTQRALQLALERPRAPLLGLITSQHWPPGRAASQYRCIRAEEPDPDDPTDTPTGYQFSVKLVPDLTEETLPAFLHELRAILREETSGSEYSVDMVKDVCPQAGITYLEKCISSIRHHMHSAGYEDSDAVTTQLIQGVRDVFR